MTGAGAGWGAVEGLSKKEKIKWYKKEKNRDSSSGRSLLNLKVLPCDMQVKRENAWHRLRCQRRFFHLSWVKILDFPLRSPQLDTSCYLGHNTSSSRWHQQFPVSPGCSMVSRAKATPSLGKGESISTINYSTSFPSVWLSCPWGIFLTLKWK